MDGKRVSYVWMTGYQVTIPDRGAWRYVPYLHWGQRLESVGFVGVSARIR